MTGSFHYFIIIIITALLVNSFSHSPPTQQNPIGQLCRLESSVHQINPLNSTIQTVSHPIDLVMQGQAKLKLILPILDPTKFQLSLFHCAPELWPHNHKADYERRCETSYKVKVNFFLQFTAKSTWIKRRNNDSVSEVQVEESNTLVIVNE